MNITITTTLADQAKLLFRVTVSNERTTFETFTATAGQIVRARNKCNARWSHIADSVTSNAIPWPKEYIDNEKQSRQRT